MAEAGDGRVDLHNHLIPGVDDGARSLEDSRVGIRRLRQAGVTAIITTPHLAGSVTLDPDRFEDLMDRVDAAWAELSRMASDEFPALRLERGHEVALDDPDTRFDDPRVRLAGTSYALVEWPRFNPPPAAELALQRIRTQGIRPLIAHVERYQGAERDLTRVARWKEAGAYVQVSYGSLLGQYGPVARSVAQRLLERGWVDVLATDLHPLPGSNVYLEDAEELLHRADGGEVFQTLSSINPGLILEDREPMPATPLILAPGFWRRFKGLIRRR
ncbi:MAG: CpsB/CapC family capsule biosynthesis tyrosine phosphatase [Gemmatimonadota bacterium]